MRSQYQNPIEKLVDIARREIEPPAMPDRASAANYRGIAGGNGTVPAEPLAATWQGEDGEGNTVTLYTAMTELDSTESAMALTGGI